MENVTHRTLWLWAHPSYYQELLQELILLFTFVETNSVGASDELQESVTKMETCKGNNKASEQPSSCDMLKIPRYKSSHNTVNMALLKDTLNRFRLTGPLSHAVILDALQIKNFPILKACLSTHDSNMDISCSKFDEGNEINKLQTGTQDSKPNEMLGSGRWLSTLLEDSYWQECFSAQNEVWNILKGATTPAELPPSIVLGLMVSDPRYQLPNKRTKSLPNEKGIVRIYFTSLCILIIMLILH